MIECLPKNAVRYLGNKKMHLSCVPRPNFRMCAPGLQSQRRPRILKKAYSLVHEGFCVLASHHLSPPCQDADGQSSVHVVKHHREIFPRLDDAYFNPLCPSNHGLILGSYACEIVLLSIQGPSCVVD